MPVLHEITEKGPRKALIFGIITPDSDFQETVCEELVLLLENLNVQVVGEFFQKRQKPDPGTYIGTGKLSEISLTLESTKADLIVCSSPLSPGQIAEIGKSTKAEVWDWPLVIMKIFQARAHSAEAKLQVELARASYELPHLRGFGFQMSRTGGGIGTRGPGETEFEKHRRKLERSVRENSKRLEIIRKRRADQRKRRKRKGLRTVALVGYTNSGKTTLLRTLSGDLALVGEHRLFSTLDTFVRRVSLPGGGFILVSDTVGFIRRLPPGLVAAFRATLEEVTEADLLILILDVSAPDMRETLETVEEMLATIGAEKIPRLVALNKIDRVEPSVLEYHLKRLRNRGDLAIPVCALDGNGTRFLLEQIEQLLTEMKTRE